MIASFMGHASLNMLLKRYGHFTDQTRREAILKFDKGDLPQLVVPLFKLVFPSSRAV